MDSDTLNIIARTGAVAAGVIFGSTAISSACFVWVRKQLFGYGGSALCTAGVVLLGLSIWHSVEFGVGASGISFKANTALRKLLEETNTQNAAAIDALGSKLTVALKESSSEQAKLHQDVQALRASVDTFQTSTWAVPNTMLTGHMLTGHLGPQNSMKNAVYGIGDLKFGDDLFGLTNRYAIGAVEK